MGPSPSKPKPVKKPDPKPAVTTTPPPIAGVSSPATPSTTAGFRRRGPTQAASPTDTAILELKVQRKSLNEATEKYGRLAEKLKLAAKELMLSQQAKENPGKAKSQAIELIKRSHLYESRLESYANTLLNIETSLDALEDSVVQLRVMNALEGGAKALETINKELSRADEVMDNLREAVAQSREINDILASTTSGPAGVLMPDGVMADDDELEAELMKLMNGGSAAAAPAKAAPEKAAGTKTAVDAVKVPTHALPEPAQVVGQQQVDAEKGEQQEEEEPERRQFAAA